MERNQWLVGRRVGAEVAVGACHVVALYYCNTGVRDFRWMIVAVAAWLVSVVAVLTLSGRRRRVKSLCFLSFVLAWPSLAVAWCWLTRCRILRP